jgi:hypothetical protein
MGLINRYSSNQGYLGPTPTEHTYRYKVVGDRVEECRTVVVYKFRLGDVEDPEIYAAEPLWQWQQTEAGKWVMANAEESPMWHRMVNHSLYSYEYAVSAKLRGAKLTEWLLRYGNSQ